MKNTLIGLLILVTLLASAAVFVFFTRPRQDRLDELMSSVAEEPAKLPELITFLDTEIAKSPEDFSLRSVRASVYSENGRPADALNDVEILVSQHPDNLNLAFIRCTLREKVGGPPREQHLDCYRDYLVRYEKIAAKPKDADPDYIVAALMAQLPEAEDLRRAYLSRLGDSEDDRRMRDLITNFRPEHLTGQ